MVQLGVVRSCNAALVKRQSLVAVFVGSTSGIGKYTVRALAAAHATSGKGLRLYIVGRNEAAAEKIISDCSKICPAGHFQFIRVDDLSLLKDVDHACAEITKVEERVDLLVMTQAYLAFEARKETKEGLDALMSLLYYSRMRFVMQLLPLLLASPSPAHIVSVFGPGRDDKIFPDDLSLRDPKQYNFMNMGSHVAYFTTFFMEELAAKHPGRLSLVHYFPGLVVTWGNWGQRLPWWLRVVWLIGFPLIRLFTVAQGECGERVLFLATPRFPARPANDTGAVLKSEGDVVGEAEIATSSDGVVGGGAYRVDWNGEMIPTKVIYKKLREEGLSKKVWDHTTEAFKVIEEGHVFTG